MDTYLKFLKKIGVPAATIDALKEETADIDTLSASFKEDQTEILTAALKPKLIEEIKPEINKEALKSVHGSLKTRMNRELNLTIPDYRGMEFDAYLDAAKKELEDRVKNGTDAEIQNKIKSITDKYSETLEEAADLKTKLAAKDAEVEAKVAEATSRLYAQTSIADTFGRITWSDQKDLVAYVQKTIREDLMNKYKIDEQGNIKNKDGTPVTKDGSTIVKTVYDLVIDDPAVKSLVKKNDARGGDDQNGKDQNGSAFKVAVGPDGKPLNPNVDTAYAEQLLKELS